MYQQCTPGASGFFHTCGQYSSCQKDYQCKHDSPFEPKAGIIISYILTPILIGIGMIGGLGGGVLKGPLLEMILNYNEKEATYIAYCFMFGGTLLNTVLLIFEKDPNDGRRPIINFRIAIIFNLAVPLATNLGSSLGTYLPQLYILIIQEIFLIVVAPIIWKKGKIQNVMQAQLQKVVEMKAKEKPLNKSQLDCDISNIQQNQIVSNPGIELEKIEEQDYSKNTKGSLQSIISPQLTDSLQSQFISEAENILPPMPILFILGSFGLNEVFIQMRSVKVGAPSYVGIQDCTLLNNLMLLVLILVNIIYGYLVYTFGVQQERQFDTLNFLPKERYFTPISRFFLIYAGGFGAGFVSGFLGMGAGFVMVPVLIQCGLLARQSSATSAFIYLMISLNNLVTLLTNDFLSWQYILLFTGLAIIGGSVVAKIGYFLLDKYKIGYVVILIVFALDIANIVSQVYYGIVSGLRYSMEYLTTADNVCNSN